MWWKWKKKTAYDVVKYWNQRDDPNSKNPDERNTKMHINFVNSNIGIDDKILDFGPGVGRVLPAYNETVSYTHLTLPTKRIV